jgi:uncharacterized membrane protein
MSKLNAFLTGAIAGSGAMYFLDSRLGRQRRKLIGDQVGRLSRRAARGIDAAMRDLGNRACGLTAEMSALVMPHDVSDDALCAHVRSVAGRYLSNPSALEVHAHQGCVELCGPVLRDEACGLVKAVSRIRGVKQVKDRLQSHETRGNIPALQGGVRRRGQPRLDLMQSNWAPGTRLLASTAGAALMANCAACRTPASMLLGAIGFGVFTRALANMDTARTFGVAGGRRAIDIQKSIEIAAPATRVYEFFSTPDNYLRISDIVTAVRSHGGGRFTKEMTIGGVPLHFEERFTRTQQGELLESRSEPGSVLQYVKQMRFERVGDNRTRLHVLFSYNPPGGVVSHAVATVLGFDPKTVLDDLLVRAKAFLETGKEPHDAVGRHLHDGATHEPLPAPRGPGVPPEHAPAGQFGRHSEVAAWPISPALAGHAGSPPTERFPPAV